MFFVGIDIAKNSHEAAIIGESGDIVVKPFKFANSLKGFEKFLAAVQGVSEDLSQFEFGMGATGHYWLNLYTKLIDFNVVVHVINPVQSDALRGLYSKKDQERRERRVHNRRTHPLRQIFRNNAFRFRSALFARTHAPKVLPRGLRLRRQKKGHFIHG